ncbi:MAG TPA: ORF6N domain-containing protein [Bacteroidales bacterium]|nr:ORF6N domain-containing protein [Bacteroidales bacterium]
MSKLQVIREENISSFIYFIRGEKVMLDADIAKLYEVETRVLKQAVRRNRKRFPDDFMFELTNEEMDFLVSQNVIPSKKVFGGSKPFAFTEQGISMLASVLNSSRAIEVNIAILRTFVKLRQLLQHHKELADRIESLERKYDEQFQMVFAALQEMVREESQPRRKIGFRRSGE